MPLQKKSLGTKIDSFNVNDPISGGNNQFEKSQAMVLSNTNFFFSILLMTFGYWMACAAKWMNSIFFFFLFFFFLKNFYFWIFSENNSYFTWYLIFFFPFIHIFRQRNRYLSYVIRSQDHIGKFLRIRSKNISTNAKLVANIDLGSYNS